MNIHEYQAKELLQRFGVATTRGKVASTPDEAEAIQVNVDNVANLRYWNSVQTGTYGIGMDRSVKFNARIDF